MTDKTSTAPVMSLQDVYDRLIVDGSPTWAPPNARECATLAAAIRLRALDAPTPDVVGGDVVAWQYRNVFAGEREGAWRDCTKRYYDEWKDSGDPTIELRELVVATRVQGDADHAGLARRLRVAAKALFRERVTFAEDLDTMTEVIATLEALAAQPKGDDLVRYCPECSSIGDVPPGARDCCPDGSAARHIPKHIAEAFAQLNLIAMQRHPAEQTR